MGNKEKKYVSISDVQASQVHRISTGQKELDWLYGISQFDGIDEWGMPKGTISTWVGEGGVGKSRLSISIAKNKVSDGETVLYFQNEVDLPTLAQWVGDDSLDHLYCSESTDLEEQAEIIKELSPSLVFVDSINLLDEYGNGNDGSIRKIAAVYRDAVKATGAHVVFLCQLNKDGSAKGSSSLKHLPDISMILTNEPGGCFKISFGKNKSKHRYGRTSEKYFGIWKHTDGGVECISRNRLSDDRWESPTDDWDDILAQMLREEQESPTDWDGIINDMKNDMKSQNSVCIAPNEDNSIFDLEVSPTEIKRSIMYMEVLTLEYEDALTKVGYLVRDNFFKANPHLKDDFYRKYPGLLYGPFGIIGKKLSIWNEKRKLLK